MDPAQFWFQQQAGGVKIGNSLRFRGGQHLAKARLGTPQTPGPYSVSYWVKRGSLQTLQCTLAFGDPIGASPELMLGYFSADDKYYAYHYSNRDRDAAQSDGALRDPSGWYHLFVSKAAGKAAILYVNGVAQAKQSSYTNEVDIFVAAASIGSGSAFASPSNVYISEFYAIDGGQALDATSFGEVDPDTGSWRPKKYTGSYGPRGFHLDFSDAANIGKDRSGNNNDFTANGFQLTNAAGTDYDWMKDSPTNNYATLNPLVPGSSALTNGNLSAGGATVQPTITPGSGSWYYEVDGTGYQWNGQASSWTGRSGAHNFGQRPFKYAPPAGFSALSTANTSAAQIATPQDHFTTILDTGANILTAAQAKFPNGLWWIKDRTGSNQHQLVDSVRGGNLALVSPAQQAESAYVAPAGNSVAWCWSAPEAFTPRQSNMTATAGRRNVAAGFSIVTYTPGPYVSGSMSIGTGLDKPVEFCLIQNRAMPSGGNNQNWIAWHKDALGVNPFGTGDTGWYDITPGTLCLNLTSGKSSYSNDSQTIGSGENYVMYSWHSVPGYSSIGSYVGNGNADGPFIYTGFRPAFVLTKMITGSGNWYLNDSGRSTFNPCSVLLNADSSGQEDGNGGMDLLSNGFKIRNTNNSQNSGNTFIYAAFAEHPFGGSNVSPAPAR